MTNERSSQAERSDAAAAPPNYRRSVKDKRGARYRKECSNCRSVRIFPMTYTCLRHLAYIRSNFVCDDWEDGRNKWGFTRMEPSEEERAALEKARPLLNLQKRLI